MDPRGVEPRPRPCHGRVLPVDYGPKFIISNCDKQYHNYTCQAILTTVDYCLFHVKQDLGTDKVRVFVLRRLNKNYAYSKKECDGNSLPFFYLLELFHLTIIFFMSEAIFTDQNFDKEVLESSTPVMVDFWAEWCGPCKLLSPTVEQLATELQGKGIKIGKMNVDENGETAAKYSVMSIPTLLFFKGGEVIDQLIGVQSKDELKKKISEIIA